MRKLQKPKFCNSIKKRISHETKQKKWFYWRTEGKTNKKKQQNWSENMRQPV